MAVPPFVLLPLVENAITHGIAERIDGGAVDIEVGREGDRVGSRSATTATPIAAGAVAPASARDLARRRLHTAYGPHAVLETFDEGSGSEVVLRWPIESPVVNPGEVPVV